MRPRGPRRHASHTRHVPRSPTVKSTVEHLSPTRVRINVEVPFDELKPNFDAAYRKIAKQVRIPGLPARQGARPGHGVAHRSRADPRRGGQRRHPGEVHGGRHRRRGAHAGPAGDRGHEDRGRRPPGVHRRGRRAPGDHPARVRRAVGVRGRPRAHRRRGRRAARRAARPLRHADRREPARGERRLRVHRPVRHGRRRGGRGGQDHRPVLRDRFRRARRGHRRGAASAPPRATPARSPPSWWPATTRARTPRSA